MKTLMKIAGIILVVFAGIFIIAGIYDIYAFTKDLAGYFEQGMTFSDYSHEIISSYMSGGVLGIFRAAIAFGLGLLLLTKASEDDEWIFEDEDEDGETEPEGEENAVKVEQIDEENN